MDKLVIKLHANTSDVVVEQPDTIHIPVTSNNKHVVLLEQTDHSLDVCIVSNNGGVQRKTFIYEQGHITQRDSMAPVLI
ncbi:hypothetical protein D3C78_19180 [compost metagenome]